MAPTFLETRTVSRKTPADGKLEITRPIADLLRRVGTRVNVVTPEGTGTAELLSTRCTCRGADNPHEHWFLVSPLMRSLIPGTVISLSLEGQKVVVRSQG